MEIKAELLYPYSEEERTHFIIEQNHRNGYEIREVERTVEYEEKVLEFEEVEKDQPIYDEEGEIIGYETVIVQKPIMVEEEIINPITGEKEIIIVQKYHYETREKIVIDLQAWGYTEEEIEEQKHQQFLKDFFNTSLGYVRRKVSMKTGETKDFLADILPILQVGIPILTYTEDGEQMKVLVTEEFIEECKQQVIKDFYGA